MSEGFDPERFFAMVRQVGHGRALDLEYRDSADNWIELALPWREELVGIPDEGILASGAIVSLLDTCGGVRRCGWRWGISNRSSPSTSGSTIFGRR